MAAGIESELVSDLRIGGEFHGAGKVVGVLEQMAARALRDFKQGPPQAPCVWVGRTTLRIDRLNDNIPADRRIDHLLDLRLDVMLSPYVDNKAGRHQRQNPRSVPFRQSL